jgi:beta-galactosidase/beta-glucuronidase
VDLFCNVALNGEELMTTNNAFLEYRVGLNSHNIRFGQNNLLEVHIYSTKLFDMVVNDNLYPIGVLLW